MIGKAAIVSNPYPDPKDTEGKLVVVDVEATRRLKTPVSLQQLRQNPKLAGMTFLKIQRIAVSPLSQTEFEEILEMA